MTIIEVGAGRTWSQEEALVFISRSVESCGLHKRVVKLKSSPGSLHWHLRKPKISGTLEATWNPETGRLWLKVHRLRKAEWIDGVIDQMVEIAGSF